jgi:hypothetical protein
MNGFLTPNDDETVPTNFIEHMHNNTESRTLRRQEWKIVVGIAEEIVQYLRSRSFYDTANLSRQFFQSFVPWLSDSARRLQPKVLTIDCIRCINRARVFCLYVRLLRTHFR